jgi:hypothetical protein
MKACWRLRRASKEAPAAARIAAAGKILNRVVGKAPPVDVTELRHTEIVYRSAEEIRKALIERGVPPAWLDLTVDEEDDADAADNADHA